VKGADVEMVAQARFRFFAERVDFQPAGFVGQPWGGRRRPSIATALEFRPRPPFRPSWGSTAAAPTGMRGSAGAVWPKKPARPGR
jgi:hypothetical protein